MTEQKTLGPKLFTLPQAEAVLPAVKEHLARFQDAYGRYEEVKREVSVLRLVSASGVDKANPDSATLQDKEREQQTLVREMQSIQHGLVGVGCVPKSIQDGLVDFFALKDERLVFLCWRQGEERIRAWHTLEAGYAGRMPIETFVDPEAAGDRHD